MALGNTTIMISKELRNELNALKIYPNETYNELIMDLVEDRMFLTEEVKKYIEIAEKQVANGETVSLEDIKKKMGLNV